MKRPSRMPCSAVALACAAFALPSHAQQTPPPGSPTGLGEQDGTWVYVVRPVDAVKDYVEALELGNAPSGIDAQFMAESQVYASLTKRGPDLCDGDPDGVSDFRVVGMKIFSVDAPYMTGTQESRVIVNQEEKQVALYLRGDVREWGPGETYCENGQLQLVGSGRGMLRMKYETTQHVLPLNFQAFPRSWELDRPSLQDTCDRFRTMALAAYQGLGPRIGLINIESPPGPIDTSVLIPNTPTVPDGMNNGSDMSGEGGMLYAVTAAQAASTAATITGVGLALAAGITGGPVAIVSGIAMVYLGNQVSNAAQGIAGMANANFHSALNSFHQGLKADPNTQAHAQHAVKTAQFGETSYAGLDADYLTNLALDMCDQLDDIPDPPEGYAAGHFSLPGSGTIQLVGAGAVPQVPAAFANGTVRPEGALSIEQMIEQVRAMGLPVPDMDAIRESLPEGVSLDEEPVLMTGNAVSGRSLGDGVYEWNVSYTVEIAREGEKIAEMWFDPRR